MSNPLILELQLHEYLREKLLTEFLEIDEETLSDTLEGLTNLHDKLAAVIRSQQEDSVLADALKIRIKEMQERHARFEDRVTKKRELVTTVMDRAGITKIAESDFTASLRQTPRPLVISDDREIPETYWKTQDPKLDRNKLIADLKSDETIPGACLGNGGVTVSVRVQ